MLSYLTQRHLKAKLAKLKSEGLTVGFVPTMGALHNGHLSLVKAAKAECDIAVCSIFVNPTQFDKKEDLVKYPVTTAADKKMLKSVDCDILFLPKVKEIYPKGSDNYNPPNIGDIANIWEGEFREGHFEGMMQVVELLLRIVEPKHIYMGLKDYQQFIIVQKMTEARKLDVKVNGMPIIRETSGLAMSSRNRRLSKDARNRALIISKALKHVKLNLALKDLLSLEKEAVELIEQEPGFKVEYLAIVDRSSMHRPKSDEKMNLIAIAAVWIEEIRLIDNLFL